MSSTFNSITKKRLHNIYYFLDAANQGLQFNPQGGNVKQEDNLQPGNNFAQNQQMNPPYNQPAAQTYQPAAVADNNVPVLGTQQQQYGQQVDNNIPAMGQQQAADNNMNIQPPVINNPDDQQPQAGANQGSYNSLNQPESSNQGVDSVRVQSFDPSLNTNRYQDSVRVGEAGVQPGAVAGNDMAAVKDLPDAGMQGERAPDTEDRGEMMQQGAPAQIGDPQNDQVPLDNERVAANDEQPGNNMRDGLAPEGVQDGEGPQGQDQVRPPVADEGLEQVRGPAGEEQEEELVEEREEVDNDDNDQQVRHLSPLSFVQRHVVL